MIPTTIALFVTALLSLIIGIYLEKFKSRITFLKYKITFNALATSIKNEFWGNIEVRYMGRETNHLSFVTIEMSNESNVDLESVNIDIGVDPESQLLGHNGFYNESGNSILLESKYYDFYSDVVQKNQKDIELKKRNSNHITPTQLSNQVNWILTNKKFHLPVFNRHTSIRLNLLTENFNGEAPQVTVNVLHKSVKLVTQRDKAEEDKRLGVNMVVWGLLAFVIGAWVVQSRYTDATIPIIIVGIMGVIYLFFGFLIYRLINLIRNLLS